jgi:hypothetical protein
MTATITRYRTRVEATERRAGRPSSPGSRNASVEGAVETHDASILGGWR